MDFTSGYKQETDIDLQVPLQGRDFVLSRSYLSNVGSVPATWFGRNWQLNVSYNLERANISTLGTINDSVLRITSLGTGTANFVYNSTANKWLPTGPTQQYIVTTDLTVDIGQGSQSYPVYKLVQPGEWNAYFYRETSYSQRNGWKDGTVLEIDDWYGNTKVFKYKENGGTDSGVWRLDTIVCTPLGGSASSDGALIEFDWFSTTHLSQVLRSKLKSVTVKRYFNPTVEWQPVQKVEYTYQIGPNKYLGTPGDLVQVVKSTLVDHEQSYESITQYRYHGGNNTNEEPGPSPAAEDLDEDDIFGEHGSAHQLKAIFLPEQIEYAAEQYNLEHTSSDLSLREYAEYLRGLHDGPATEPTHFAYGTTKVMELAAKVISQYESSGTTPEDYRVKEQYLQSACGCGGTTRGTRLVYDYTAYTSPTTYTHTLRVKEYNEATSSVRRTHYYDLKSLNNTSGGTSFAMKFLINDVIREGASSSNYWVTHYEYDTTNDLHPLKKVFTPSATSISTPYAPGNGSSTQPSYTPDYNGLVYIFDYHTDHHRLTSTYVNQKGSSSNKIELSRNTWNGSKNWLLASIKRYRTAEITTTSDPEEIETIEFNYLFHSGTGNEDKLKWVETVIEAELETENGPDGTTNKYYSHEYFSEGGLNVWSRRPDNTLVRRRFYDDTGAVKDVIENMEFAESGEHEEPDHDGLATGTGMWIGRNDDGNTLTTHYDYDVVGRLRMSTSPSDLKTRYIRELKAPAVGTQFASNEVPYLAFTRLPDNLTGGFAGPAEVTIVNAAGHAMQSSTFALSSNSSSAYNTVFSSLGGYEFQLGTTELSRSTVQRHLSGMIQSTKVYHRVMALDGENGGVYQTDYSYDSLGHLETVTSPNHTVTKYTYDVHDRVVKIEVGTDDTSTNLSTVSENFYDCTVSTAGQGVGNGNLTWVKQYTGESSPLDVRDTKYTFDYRDRLIKVVNPVAPACFC